MIDYLSEARITATVSVSGNLSRTLGVALSLFHREASEKIRRLEASNEAGRDYMVAILKTELTEFERWHRNIEGLIAYQRDSKATAEAEMPENQHREEVAA